MLSPRAASFDVADPVRFRGRRYSPDGRRSSARRAPSTVRGAHTAFAVVPPRVVKYTRVADGDGANTTFVAFAEVDLFVMLEAPNVPAPPQASRARQDERQPRISLGGPATGLVTCTWLAPLLLGLCLLALWEAATRIGHAPPLILPSPGGVLTALWRGLADGSLLSAAGFTLLESLCGFAVGAAVALPIGYGVARSRMIAAALQPYLAASQALPAVALAPLFVVWLGYGLPPIAALAALIVFFPAAITTTLGVRTLDKEVIDAARVDGASGWQLLLTIELPLALPAVLAGLRTSLTLSVTGAVVGEFVLGGFGTGLGSLSTQTLQHFDTAELFAVLIVLGAMASLLYGIARLIERRISYMEGV